MKKILFLFLALFLCLPFAKESFPLDFSEEGIKKMCQNNDNFNTYDECLKAYNDLIRDQEVYDECILENVKGQTGAALGAIQTACKEKARRSYLRKKKVKNFFGRIFGK